MLTAEGTGKNIEKAIENALLELKEESFKLKQQTDAEIKEKKLRFCSKPLGWIV